MHFIINHDWDLSPKQAITLQQQLADQVIRRDELTRVQRVAGVDVGFEDANKITRAAIAVLSFPELQLLDYRIARIPTCFPYVPGLLSFREIPAIAKALAALPYRPDLLLCDGQGLAHPRRFGIACHLGVLCDIPAIGVAKTRLIGRHEAVADHRGAWQPLLVADGHGGQEVVGAVLRSRPRCKPIYISSGHKIALKTAIYYVMTCITRYRLPETTRWADKLASGKIDFPPIA